MEIKKVLTFRASSIGDCLMAKYFFENVRATHPKAQCVILVAGKSAMVRDLLAAYPWIEVVEANTRHPRTIFSAFKKLYPSNATVTQYSSKGTFSTSSKLFARLLTRFGGLVGFTDAWPFNRRVYDHLIPFDTRRAIRLHECDALRALGIPICIKEMTLAYKKGSAVLETYALLKGSYLVLNLFSASRGRGLSLEHQIAIARKLQAEFGSLYKIILTGGSSDEPLMLSIKDAVSQVLIAPALSMQDLVTLVAKSRVVVSLDTGVGHIAAQTGVPLVILRTCWGYNWWNNDQYPRKGITVLAHDELCADEHISVDFPACLSAISSEEVADAVQKII